MSKKSKKKKKKSKFKSRLSFLTGVMAALLILFAANTLVQVIRKPAEILNALGLSTTKTPYETWLSYSNDFKAHATNEMKPHFLAALAQTESSGNAAATPEWNLKWTDKLTKIFSPASSSVGLYQFTTGTYNRAKKLCIQDGAVVKEGPWHQLNSCWFNFLYLRTSASHSIEMASAYLTLAIQKMTKNIQNVSQSNINRLAAVIHLCGEKKGEYFIKTNFNLNRLSHCGTHSVKNYVAKVERNLERFSRYP